MKYLVISSHISKYTQPIKFHVNEVVRVGVQDEEYPGWIWVTTADGNQGWAPTEYLLHDVDAQTARASQDYSSKELNTHQGELLTCLVELSGWAWVKNEQEEMGWVPINTLQSI